MTERAGADAIVRVELLADHTEDIPTLARWYQAEWSTWFADSTNTEIEADIRNTAQRDCLPIGFVARNNGVLAGFCTVRAEPFDAYPGQGPWLRRLYVDHTFRGQGIAGELIAAVERTTAAIGIATLYAATHDAIGTFERAGWLGFDQVMYDDKLLTIFARRISVTRTAS